MNSSPVALLAGASGEHYRLVVSAADEGCRLDMYLADQLPMLSRSASGSLIRSGRNVLVNGEPRKAGYRVRNGDQVQAVVPPPSPVGIVPEEVPFVVLYEDDDLVVIVKPPGVVVHPGCGHDSGTLVHGLLYHCDNLSGINGELRPGIVHRLDKDTSGVMVAAKSDKAHLALVEIFKNRQVKKIYRAIVRGRPATEQGRIDLPIGRHPVNRRKMAIRERGGRPAITEWRVLAELGFSFTYLELRLHTGRTHQIRVHMAHLGCPVAGDVLYGRKPGDALSVKIKRQCLHAYQLAFNHPVSGEPMSFTAPLWPDMAEILEWLRQG